MKFLENKTIKKVFYFFLYVFAVVGIVFVFVFIAMQFGWLNVRGSASQRDSYFEIVKDGIFKNEFSKPKVIITGYWIDTDEWRLMKEVFIRDQEIIHKAAFNAGVSPRMLLGGIIGEQFRFFTNSRESFKQYFEPLKILASLSQTSYGIAGLKPKTVRIIDENLKNSKSEFYLGPEMENIISYEEGADFESVRFQRITDVKDPYYSYLYVGLYMKQIIAQWQKAGFDIEKRPEILGTLYNLGFYYSRPKANPISGGSTINIGNYDYIFGDLTYEFYYSDELIDIFPY